MKINKKIFIPILSTTVGLSVIGGIAGAFAWYQYNSKVNTSFVGASVADTGVLQIGTMQKVVDAEGNPEWVDPNVPDDQKVQKETIVWGRDFNKGKAEHLIPVTFGALEEHKDPVLDENGDPVDLDQDGEDDTTSRFTLPSTAYSYPEAGCGEGYLPRLHTDEYGRECNIPGWKVAEEGKDYAEFEVYFRALQSDPSNSGGFTQVERNVFISDYIFKSVVLDKYAHEALRVYIEVNDGHDGAYILANNEHIDLNDYSVPNFDYEHDYDPALDGRLKLYGGLNLDHSNELEANPNASENDVYRGSVWNDFLASYGVHGDKWPVEKRQLPPVDSTDPDEEPQYEDVVVAGTPFKEGEEICYGNYGDTQTTTAISSVKQARDAQTGKMPEQGEAGYEKALFKTSKDEAVKVRVVIWLEGWEPMKVDDNDTMKREWNPAYTAETAVQVGLQFDSGIFRGNDLNDLADQNNQNTPNSNQNP